MKHRTVGRTGVQVSALGLGSWYTLGSTVDEQQSISVIKRAYEKGVALFDTANVYSKEWRSGTGEAEVLVGKALSDYDRSSFVLLTKVGGKMGLGKNDHGLSAKHIKEQCEASLGRLGTDHIDIYMCHCDDKLTPVEVTVRAMEDLSRQGKIIYWGAEWPPEKLVKGLWTCERQGARPLVATEIRYNLLYRFPELDLFPVLEQEGMGAIVFSPIAQGVLTDKYLPGQPPPAGSRAADEKHGKYIRKLYYSQRNLTNIQRMAAIASDIGATTAHLALAWVLERSTVSAAIFGATTPEQVDRNVGAAELTIPADVMAELDRLFPTPEVIRTDGSIPTLVTGAME